MKKTRAQLWDEKRDLMKRMNDIQAAASERGEPRTEAEEREYTAHGDRIQEIETIMRQEDEHEANRSRQEAPQNTRNLNDPEETPEAAAELRSKAYSRAFNRFVRFGKDGLEGEDVAALRAGRPNLNDPAEARTLSSILGTAGGYLVTPSFQTAINETQKFFGGALTVGAEVWNTASGEDIYYPTNDDTANVGEIIAQGGTVGSQDMTFGQKKVGAFMGTSKMVKVPLQLLADESFGLEAYLGRKLGERLARLKNLKFTIGTGHPNEPEGMVTGATSTVTTAGATAITLNEFIDLEFSVDPAYRNSPRCKYMMADSALKLARKLQDTTGRPLWEPSVKEGVPSVFNGRAYEINNDMPAPTASNKAVLFGDFYEFYVIRNVGSTVMFRLNELYIENLQQGFFAIERFDGGVKNTAAVKAMTMHA